MSINASIARNLAVATCTAAAILLPATAANAEPADFAYHPRELRTDDGIERMLERMGRAARTECRNELLVVTKAEKQCRRDVTAEWIARIGNPRLTLAWRDRIQRLAMSD